MNYGLYMLKRRKRMTYLQAASELEAGVKRLEESMTHTLNIRLQAELKLKADALRMGAEVLSRMPEYEKNLEELEQLRKLQLDCHRAFKDGIRLYAWWKNGVQYVGTAGKTLELALSEADGAFGRERLHED